MDSFAQIPEVFMSNIAYSWIFSIGPSVYGYISPQDGSKCVQHRYPGQPLPNHESLDIRQTSSVKQDEPTAVPNLHPFIEVKTNSSEENLVKKGRPKANVDAEKILSMISQGLSQKEIGKIVGVTDRTIRNIIKEQKRKKVWDL